MDPWVKERFTYHPVRLLGGVIHWWYLYKNAKVVLTGNPPAIPGGGKKLKFPGDRLDGDERLLSARGITAFGRPLAKVGDHVWVANAKLQMLTGNVGTLREIRSPEPDGRQLATVEMLNGQNNAVLYLSCNPLSEPEFKTAQQHYGKW